MHLNWVLILCRHAERLCSLEPSEPSNSGTGTKAPMLGVSGICETAQAGIRSGVLNSKELQQRTKMICPNVIPGSLLHRTFPDSEDQAVRGFTTKLAVAVSEGLTMSPTTGGMDVFAFHALSWSDAVISAILNDWLWLEHMPTEPLLLEHESLMQRWRRSVRLRICSELMRDIRLLADLRTKAEHTTTGDNDAAVRVLGPRWAQGFPEMWPHGSSEASGSKFALGQFHPA